jgi:hypothetical protein
MTAAIFCELITCPLRRNVNPPAGCIFVDPAARVCQTIDKPLRKIRVGAGLRRRNAYANHRRHWQTGSLPSRNCFARKALATLQDEISERFGRRRYRQDHEVPFSNGPPNRGFSEWAMAIGRHIFPAATRRQVTILTTQIHRARWMCTDEPAQNSKPIQIVLTSRPTTVSLAVQNQATPIDPLFLPRLFSPFARSADTGHSSDGLGLGLYISERIIAAHGGQLTVQSSQETGT